MENRKSVGRENEGKIKKGRQGEERGKKGGKKGEGEKERKRDLLPFFHSLNDHNGPFSARFYIQVSYMSRMGSHVAFLGT